MKADPTFDDVRCDPHPCHCGRVITGRAACQDGSVPCKMAHWPRVERPDQPIEIAEGIAGTWFYHLRRSGENYGLCGAKVMLSYAPLDAWGMRTHLGERWCSLCSELRVERPEKAEPKS